MRFFWNVSIHSMAFFVEFFLLEVERFRVLHPDRNDVGREDGV